MSEDQFVLNNELNAAIGKALMDRRSRNSGPLDLEGIARDLGVEVAAVEAHMAFLTRQNLVRLPVVMYSVSDIPPMPEIGDRHLTPAGVEWAKKGFPPEP